MFSLKIQNTNGDLFELTHDNPHYYITSIQGLTPPPTIINTATAGTIDGTFFNSARLEQRNLVITIVLNGDIEANRQKLYTIFPRKTKCTVFFKNKNRSVKIDGYVETLEADLFTQREQVHVSIICPRPYFEALNTLYNELSRTLALFQFPFSIVTPIPFSEYMNQPVCRLMNTGDAACGTIIEVDVKATVSGLKIINTTSHEFFELNYTFENNDRVIINTGSGSMGVQLLREGTRTNLLNFVTQGSSWLKILPGLNVLTFTLESGSDEDVNIHLTTALLYGGV